MTAWRAYLTEEERAELDRICQERLALSRAYALLQKRADSRRFRNEVPITPAKRARKSDYQRAYRQRIRMGSGVASLMAEDARRRDRA